MCVFLCMTTAKPPRAPTSPVPRLRHVPLSGGDVRDVMIEAVSDGLLLTFLPTDPKTAILQAKLTAEEARSLASALRSEKAVGGPPKPAATLPPRPL